MSANDPIFKHKKHYLIIQKLMRKEK